jgi:ABC-type transport system involved in multi-copper enzyme maturation permease subunit
MRSIWIIALNTISEIFRRKVLYVAVAATLVFELPNIATFVQSRYLSEAEFLRAELEHQTGTIRFFSVWATASIYLAVALASVALSWERKEGTILTVLAHPVSRTRFLVGKWLGALMMTLSYLLLGIIVGLLFAWQLGVPILPLLKLALTATVASILCFSATSIMLSVSLSPVTTSVIGVFMVMAPDLVGYLFDHRLATVRTIASILYFIIPAGMPVDLIGASFGKVMLNPNYSLYSRGMFENLSYGTFALMLACSVFSRREIQAAS